MVTPQGRDTLILTVNQRLSRHLLFKHSENQKNSGKRVWEAPQILELRSWFKSKWINSNPDHFLLSEIQSLKIWETIIQNSSTNEKIKNTNSAIDEWRLLNYYSAAEQAANAYQKIKEHRLSISSDPLLLNIENNLFIEWMDRYQGFLFKIKAIDPVVLIDVVRERMKEKLIPIPKRLELHGFEEITPQLQIWLEFLKSKKVKISINANSQKKSAWTGKKNISNKNIKIHSFTDLKNESRNCANWIRSIYNKGQSIGIVVPELDKYRQTLHKEIITNLIPQSIFPWERNEIPFDISIGTPLSSEGMVQIALDIISISTHVVPISKFIHIINNPYIKSGRVNAQNRSLIEIKLKKENLPILDLEFLETFYDKDACPDLKILIDHLINLSSKEDAELPSTWANIFSQLLKNLSWTANPEKILSSREIQCLSSWNECLDNLASLDSFIGKVSRLEVIIELKQIISKKLFQIKTKEHPIQILSLNDSVGIEFDNLWVMGCHSDCIPAQPNPNPFIPIHLQKKKQLPHCDSKYELKFAEQALSRLVAASNNIIFSYPEWEQGNIKNISSLLDCLNISITDFPNTSSYRLKDLIKPLDKIELWQDETNINLSSNEIKKFTESGLPTGYKLIQNQVDCPFQAFAAHRLQADVYKVPTIDYDARERGVLVHKVLQLFWEKHKNRDGLQILKSSNLLKHELEEITNEAIKETSNWLSKQPYFSTMEQERTVSLLTSWMNQELLRSDFTVQYTEKKETIFINNLKLSLRIDRIDITSENKIILIDYKTGSINTSDWLTNRIQEPQLPLYSTKLSPDGIVIAHISKGSLKWNSVYNQNIKSPFLQDANMKTPSKAPENTGWPDWDSLLRFWKNQMNGLAGEFMQGLLIINPIKKSGTCKNCGYKMLCRIGENYFNDHNSEH